MIFFVEQQIAKESKDQIAKLIKIIKNGSTRGRYQIQKRNNNKTLFLFCKSYSFIYIYIFHLDTTPLQRGQPLSG